MILLIEKNKLGNMPVGGGGGGGGGYSPNKVTGVLVVPFRSLKLWIRTA